MPNLNKGYVEMRVGWHINYFWRIQ